MQIKDTFKRSSMLFGVLIFMIGQSALAQFQSNPLSQAVDDEKNNYVSESPSFFRQTEVSNVGGDAAQSADIDADEISAMAVEVNGPARIGFDWKVSSEANFDFLTVTIFDSGFSVVGEIKRISGNKDWSREELVVPDGEHFVVWAYVKDFDTAVGADAGWVDNVAISVINRDRSIAPILSLLLEEEPTVEAPDISQLYPPIDPLRVGDGKLC